MEYKFFFTVINESMNATSKKEWADEDDSRDTFRDTSSFAEVSLCQLQLIQKRWKRF